MAGMRDVSGFVAMLFAFVILAAFPAFSEENGKVVEVWKNPSCGCCGKWVEHMRAAGFNVKVNERDDLDALKTKLGVPSGLRSCHTATINGYVIEGHVPAGDVAQLLTKRPQIMGLSVPGMPLGSPGMEVASGQRDAFDTVSFDRSGRSAVFAHHPGHGPN